MVCSEGDCSLLELLNSENWLFVIKSLNQTSARGGEKGTGQEIHVEVQSTPGKEHFEYLSITLMISAPYFSSLSSVTPSICSNTSVSEDKVSATQRTPQTCQTNNFL